MDDQAARERVAAEASQGQPSGDMRTLLLTVEEAADQLRVHRSTVWDLIKRRELTVVRLGRKATRVTKESLLGYVERHATVA